MPEKNDLKQTRQLIVLAIIFAIGLISWTLHPRAFIWDDSYFYMVIARNIVLDGSQTFSNLYITNGIHPIWLYLLTGYSYLVSIFDPEILFNPVYAVPLSAFLVFMGVVNFWKAADLLKLPRLLFCGLPLCYVLFFHVLYSEAHVYYATLSWLILLMARNFNARSQSPCLIGLACAFVFLGRLDSVFTVMCFLGWYLLSKRNLRTAILTFVPMALLILPYLLSNYYYFGGLSPVSGWLKSSFPHIFLGKPSGPNSFFGYNIVAGVVPVIIAVIFFPILKVRGSVRNLIMVLLTGSILHFFYTAFFTRFHTMYFWYYIPNTLLLTCICAVLIKQYRVPGILKTAGVFAMLLLFCFLNVSQRWGNTNASRKIQAPIAELLNYMKVEKIEKTSILVSDVPGVIAYFTTNNLIATDMVTSSKKLYVAMLKSENALDYLMDYCEKKESPIKYYCYFGSDFIQHDKDGYGITYNDPKYYPELKPIGRYDLGSEPVFISSNSFCKLWKID